MHNGDEQMVGNLQHVEFYRKIWSCMETLTPGLYPTVRKISRHYTNGLNNSQKENIFYYMEKWVTLFSLASCCHSIYCSLSASKWGITRGDTLRLERNNIFYN